jgi:hypothetical protein
VHDQGFGLLQEGGRRRQHVSWGRTCQLTAEAIAQDIRLHNHARIGRGRGFQARRELLKDLDRIGVLFVLGRSGCEFATRLLTSRDEVDG